jgi:hypothetical protein
MNKKLLIRLALPFGVAGLVLAGLMLRQKGMEVKEIDPNELLKKGKVHLTDVIESPVVVDYLYEAPATFTCANLKKHVLRLPFSEIKTIPLEQIKVARCEDELRPWHNQLAVQKFLQCLQGTSFNQQCKARLMLLRFMAINDLVEADPELLQRNQYVGLHKLLWELLTNQTETKEKLDEYITRLDHAIAVFPNVYALYKAKLIHVIKKDVLFGDKVIDDQMYKTWETMTELRADTQDIWELRLMNVLSHKIFYEASDMKHWLENFMLDFPDFDKTYYYWAYFAHEILNDKKEAKEWLNVGIGKTGDKSGLLTKTMKKLDSANKTESLFPFEFPFEFIFD